MIFAKRKGGKYQFRRVAVKHRAWLLSKHGIKSARVELWQAPNLQHPQLSPVRSAGFSDRMAGPTLSKKLRECLFNGNANFAQNMEGSDSLYVQSAGDQYSKSSCGYDLEGSDCESEEDFKGRLTAWVNQMMFVSGETAEPSTETTGMIEELVKQQVIEMVSRRIVIVFETSTNAFPFGRSHS